MTGFKTAAQRLLVATSLVAIAPAAAQATLIGATVEQTGDVAGAPIRSVSPIVDSTGFANETISQLGILASIINGNTYELRLTNDAFNGRNFSDVLTITNLAPNTELYVTASAGSLPFTFNEAVNGTDTLSLQGKYEAWTDSTYTFHDGCKCQVAEPDSITDLVGGAFGKFGKHISLSGIVLAATGLVAAGAGLMRPSQRHKVQTADEYNNG